MGQNQIGRFEKVQHAHDYRLDKIKPTRALGHVAASICMDMRHQVSISIPSISLVSKEEG